MTKQVRIENADMSAYKVRVRVEYKDTTTGEWKPSTYDETKKLEFPTAMATDYLTSHKRLVVEEYEDKG